MKIGFYLIQQITESIIGLAESAIECAGESIAKTIIKKIKSL